MASKFPEKFSQHIAELCGLVPNVGPLGGCPLLAIVQMSPKEPVWSPAWAGLQGLTIIIIWEKPRKTLLSLSELESSLVL